MKQSTFGEINVVKLEGKTSNNPHCNHKNDFGKECENRAILFYRSTLNNEIQFRCGIHAKKWHKKEVEIE